MKIYKKYTQFLTIQLVAIYFKAMNESKNIFENSNNLFQPTNHQMNFYKTESRFIKT